MTTDKYAKILIKYRKLQNQQAQLKWGIRMGIVSFAIIAIFLHFLYPDYMFTFSIVAIMLVLLSSIISDLWLDPLAQIKQYLISKYTKNELIELSHAYIKEQTNRFQTLTPIDDAMSNRQRNNVNHINQEIQDINLRAQNNINTMHVLMDGIDPTISKHK